MGFAQGFQVGSNAVTTWRDGERRKEREKQEDWRFQQEQEAALRLQNTRADLGVIAQRG
jgi:hypothetical protein